MADLPHPWSAYARLQAELSRGDLIDDQSWGMEAALNRILDSIQHNQPLQAEQIVRTAASASKRERYRARLRLVHLASSDPPYHPEGALAARQELRVVYSNVSKREWTILREVAFGRDYAEVVSIMGGTQGGLRVRVLRLRQRLAAGRG